MYDGVNLPRHAKPKREVSKEGCVKGIQGRRDARYAYNTLDESEKDYKRNEFVETHFYLNIIKMNFTIIY